MSFLPQFLQRIIILLECGVAISLIRFCTNPRVFGVGDCFWRTLLFIWARYTTHSSLVGVYRSVFRASFCSIAVLCGLVSLYMGIYTF